MFLKMRLLQWSSLVIHLVLQCLTSFTDCLNIDTKHPILREVNGIQNGSLFGYSLVLHQTLSNVSNIYESLSGVRIIVSAPKATAPEASVPNTGLVYSCPVNPGNCSGLPGKLFDTTPNEMGEDKTNQFLGASMVSNGERFMVCAHRYIRIVEVDSISYILLPGKCFHSERTLDSFQEYRPCSITNRNALCQPGTSSVIVPDGNSYAFALGAPGIDEWKGVVIRLDSQSRTTVQDETRRGNESYYYQGYSIASGQFITTNRQDFVVSSPRENVYYGTVNLVMNDNSLQFVSEPLMGMQMGEYYGFSLLAADFNGDGFDELLVGAPLYRANSSQPETGRVFLYRNNGGNLEFVRTIEGRTQYSRFGYAMANLGDINGDGFDDVAISAPFSETGSSDPGTVYIYHSVSSMLLLCNEPQQIIRGSDLNLNQDLSGLRGFGTSLASGVDVDLNGYNDLLIGSFLSQKVFLLRTYPIAHVQTRITANPTAVDLTVNETLTECAFNNVFYPCFTLRTCANYSGQGLTSRLNLRFKFSADSHNIEQRVFFENGANMISEEVAASIGTEICTTPKTAFVKNDTFDIYSPFVMELTVESLQQQDIRAGNGNETVQDLSHFPVVMVTGITQTQVETVKDCGGEECIPDLRITVIDTQVLPCNEELSSCSSSSVITAGLTKSVHIIVSVENFLEDAFQATVSFATPRDVVILDFVVNQTRNGEVSLRCISEHSMDETQSLFNLTEHTCYIGNPLSGGEGIQLRVQLSPMSTIFGNENDILINFTVGSINPEDQETVINGSNFAEVELTFDARANITVDNGVVTPERISYSDNTALNTGGVNLTSVSQLGPPVDVSFLVRNSGPSRISEIQLDISWPLNSILTGENYYLYITSIQSSGTALVACSKPYINPLGLESDSDVINDEGTDPTVIMGNRRRRKRRNTVKRTLRDKRQEDVASQGHDPTEDVTLSCMTSDPALNCVNIRCNILGLAGSGSVQIDINSRLDERYFSSSNDRYLLIPTASVSIVNSDYIISNNDSIDRSAVAEIKVIPAAQVSIATPVPWWIIAAAVGGSLLIITGLGILLRMCGFFNRKKHQELKQKREELQNLQEFELVPNEIGTSCVKADETTSNNLCM